MRTMEATIIHKSKIVLFFFFLIYIACHLTFHDRLDETELSGIIQGLVKKHQSANLPLLMRECPGVTETALKSM